MVSLASCCSLLSPGQSLVCLSELSIYPQRAMENNEWVSYCLHCSAYSLLFTVTSFSKENKENLFHSQPLFHFWSFSYRCLEIFLLLFGNCEGKAMSGRGILCKAMETSGNLVRTANNLVPVGEWQEIQLEIKAGIQSRRQLVLGIDRGVKETNEEIVEQVCR